MLIKGSVNYFLRKKNVTRRKNQMIKLQRNKEGKHEKCQIIRKGRKINSKKKK